MKTKKFIATAILTTMITMLSTTIFATSNDYLTLNRGSEDDIRRNQENLRILEEEWANTPMPYAYNITKRLDVPAYRQETTYWCGPANVKQVIQFINGNSSSQSTYASSMGTASGVGTYVYKLTNELNKRQSKFTYAYEEISTISEADMRDKIIRNVVNDKPMVLHAKTKSLYMYNGADLGHYLTVSGYMLDTTGPGTQQPPQAYYVDPYYKDYGRGSVFGTHTDTISNICNCVKGRFIIQ